MQYRVCFFVVFILFIAFDSMCQFGPSRLKQMLEQSEGTERLEILTLLCDTLKTQDPKEAADYAREALKMVRKSGNDQAEFLASLCLARIEYRADKLKRATQFAEQALAATASTGDQIARMEVLELLIPIYRASGKSEQMAEAELELLQVRNSLDLQTRTQQLEDLHDDYSRTSRQLEISEAEREKLEIATLRLATQTARDSVELLQKENEIDAYNAELKRQQLLRIIFSIAFALAVIISVTVFLYFQQKRRRTIERANMQRQLVIQERMATLGQLTAGIAHEIKNPLNFVTNFAEGSSELTEELAEVLEESQNELRPDKYRQLGEIIEDLKQNADDIKRNGSRIDLIVQGMMDHAKGEKGKLQPTDINRLVKNTLNLSYLGYKALGDVPEIEIDQDFTQDLPEAEVVPQDIARVVLNVLNNAFYAVNEKSGSQDKHYIPAVSIGTRCDDHEVKISIRDNGAGIPKEVEDKMFNPFFTTKPTGKGNTGLGLSIAYDIIVQAHNGQIDVDTKQGMYTEITITLPITQEKVTL